jgi:dienelactone hydrolase
MPAGRGPFPAIVLVHGSGPNDRDESMGPNKLFRDLAWGLASQGIAVLRYDKRTKIYGAKMSAMAGHFTVNDETVDDALAAVNLLRKTSGVNAKRIFVLGHSLGGTLLPRIGRRDTKIAGLIVLAGATKPLDEVIVEQTIYLISLDGTISRAEQDYLDEQQRQAAAIKKLTPADLDSPVILFGGPPSYWLDLRGYNPPEAARPLKQRMLILQGERDYQVTMDDYARWKAALSSKPNVSFKSYPGLNHHFIAGTGQRGPTEYDVAGHAAENVVTDIANWIKRTK